MNQTSFDFKSEEINLYKKEEQKFGYITEFDRLVAAKQILMGLAVLYVITLITYIFAPDKGNDLIEIIKMVFPPLATLIITFYFRDNKTS